MGAGASATSKQLNDHLPSSSSSLPTRKGRIDPRSPYAEEKQQHPQEAPILEPSETNNGNEHKDVNVADKERLFPVDEISQENCDDVHRELFRYEAEFIDLQDEVDEPEESLLTQSAEILSPAAMSFDMDYQDLLFNLLYFNENPQGISSASLDAAIETANIETFAAHSQGNTPYKLRPASEKTKSCLLRQIYDPAVQILESCECVICKDDMEEKCEIILLERCKHCFHSDCFVRWITLQGLCPVCREVIDDTSEEGRFDASTIRPDIEEEFPPQE